MIFLLVLQFLFFWQRGEREKKGLLTATIFFFFPAGQDETVCPQPSLREDDVFLDNQDKTTHTHTQLTHTGRVLHALSEE